MWNVLSVWKWHTNGASSETPNNKHPGNKTDKKKEKMKRNIQALEQLLEFKDCVIRKKKKQ